MESKSKKAGGGYRPIIGIFALLFIARIGYKIVKQVQQSEEQTKKEKYQVKQQEQKVKESHAYGLDLEKNGVLFMKMDNKPYPLFYISVLDSTILREETLVPLARRVILHNNLGSKIELDVSYSKSLKTPGEVKYIFNQNFDHILAEKVFVIKKGKWNKLFYEELE